MTVCAEKIDFRFLLHGLDAVQVCYGLFPGSGGGIDVTQRLKEIQLGP